MKKNKYVLILLVITMLSCVQPSSKKTVILKLNVQDVKNIEMVGIRGNGNPLSWNSDLELKPIVKDTLYTATFSVVTGYKFIEAKFTVNGDFEFQDKDNRRIYFSEKDTTLYEAKFNQPNDK